MRKRLTAIGNSFGFIIEKPILELIKVDRDTEFEVTTDGKSLVLTPTETTPRAHVLEALSEITREHRETFKKLAS